MRSNVPTSRKALLRVASYHAEEGACCSMLRNHGASTTHAFEKRKLTLRHSQCSCGFAHGYKTLTEWHDLPFENASSAFFSRAVANGNGVVPMPEQGPRFRFAFSRPSDITTKSY